MSLILLSLLNTSKMNNPYYCNMTNHTHLQESYCSIGFFQISLSMSKMRKGEPGLRKKRKISNEIEVKVQIRVGTWKVEALKAAKEWLTHITKLQLSMKKLQICPKMHRTNITIKHCQRQDRPRPWFLTIQGFGFVTFWTDLKVLGTEK